MKHLGWMGSVKTVSARKPRVMAPWGYKWHIAFFVVYSVVSRWNPAGSVDIATQNKHAATHKCNGRQQPVYEHTRCLD